MEQNSQIKIVYIINYSINMVIIYALLWVYMYNYP